MRYRIRSAGCTSLWRGCGSPPRPREIADQARIGTNVCSALLRRLMQRGSVAVDGGTPRRRQYYLTERMYNIYYLLRRRGDESRVVDALIAFMASYYTESELLTLGVGLARDSKDADAYVRELAHAAFRSLIERLKSDPIILELLTADEVVDHFGADEIPGITWLMAAALLDRAGTVADEGGTNEALAAYDEVIHRFEASDSRRVKATVASAMTLKGLLLQGTGRPEDALFVYDEIIQKFGDTHGLRFTSATNVALQQKCFVLADMGRPTEALEVLDGLTDRLKVCADDGLFAPDIFVLRAVSQIMIDPDESGLAALEKALDYARTFESSASSPVVAHALAIKQFLLASTGRAISASEVEDPTDLRRDHRRTDTVNH